MYFEKYVGEIFDTHFNAYRIKTTGEFGVVNLSNIFDYRPVVVKSNFVNTNNDLYAIFTIDKFKKNVNWKSFV